MWIQFNTFICCSSSCCYVLLFIQRFVLNIIFAIIYELFIRKYFFFSFFANLEFYKREYDQKKIRAEREAKTYNEMSNKQVETVYYSSAHKGFKEE
jgi:23S rRNA maturation mini-RNase III